MARRRVLLVHNEGPLRDALARALAREGHQVDVAVPAEARERLAESAAETILCAPGDIGDRVEAEGVRWVELGRPVDMEELRRALRES